MFTGIIRQVGTVRSVQQRPQSRTLVLEAGPLADEVAVGDSVSVDGACLTAVQVQGSRIAFDVGAETLRLTTLEHLREGTKVNLEAALRMGDRLGGHFVSGHVDGTGTIRRKRRLPGEVRLEVEVAPHLTEMMIQKGSVAVDGISLTIAALRREAFEVSLIPHTLAVTALQYKGPGDRVNIECDLMGRWIKRLLGRDEAEPNASPENTEPVKGPLSVRELEEQGF